MIVVTFLSRHFHRVQIMGSGGFYLRVMTFLVLVFHILSADYAIAAKVLGPGWVEQFDEVRTVKDLRDEGWSIPRHGDLSKQFPAYIRMEGQEDSQSRVIAFYASEPKKLTVVSPLFKVQGEELVTVSASMRVDAVRTGVKEWYKPRVVMQVLDESNKPIATFPVGSIDGTEAWTRFEHRYVLPRDSAGIRLILEMNRCSGKAYFDNIGIMVELPKPPALSLLEPEFVEEPSILPVPRYYERSAGRISLDSLSYRFGSGDARLLANVKEFARQYNIGLSPDDLGKEGVVIRSLDTSSEEGKVLVGQLENSLKTVLSEPQGYLLSVTDGSDGRGLITLLSSTDIGRYFAFQTIRQLVHQEGKDIRVPLSVTVDSPRYILRGVVFGDLRRWFQGPPKKNPGHLVYGSGRPYRDWARELKLNFVWLTGWTGVYNRTAAPLKLEDTMALQRFREDCDSSFITPSVGFRPYRQTPRKSRQNGGVVYGATEDIDVIVNNYETLYRLGFRNFHMAFDDQPFGQVLQYPEDRKMFNEAGRAHRYFINQVYDRIRSLHKDIVFRVIVIPYARILSAQQRTYIDELRKLPTEIEFVWVGDSVTAARSYRAAVGERPILAWSNFFPNTYSSQKSLPLVSYPFAGVVGDLESYVTGLIFHPLDTVNYSQSAVSWSTAADYMWRGVDYNPVQSLARSIIKIVGRDRYRDAVSELYTNRQAGSKEQVRLPSFPTPSPINGSGSGNMNGIHKKKVLAEDIIHELLTRCAEDLRCSRHAMSEH